MSARPKTKGQGHYTTKWTWNWKQIIALLTILEKNYQETSGFCMRQFDVKDGL